MIQFYYGEETFQSSQKMQKLKKDFIANTPSSEPMVFDCDEMCDVESIAEAFGVQDLFVQQKMIIIKNFFANTKADQQKKLVTHLEKETSDTIIFWEEGVPRKNATLFVWLQKNASVAEENKDLQGAELEKWITAKCADEGVGIARDALRELILYVGGDLWRMSQEIKKLACYADGEISLGDVQALVHGRTDADMFQTIEAITARDRSRAMTLLKKQLAKGDEPFHIFSMYAYQVRTLLLVSGVVQETGSSDKNTVARTLKMHPFVAQKSMAVVQRVSHNDLKKMHKSITILDHDVKQGKRDIHGALDLFVTSI